MDSKYPTAPELPGKHTDQNLGKIEPAAEEPAAATAAPKIQLIASTKSHNVEVRPIEDAFADDEVLVLGDEDELNEHVDYPGDPDGVVANDQIKQWQQEHPLPVAKQKKRKPFWLRAFITLVVIAALTAGAWWYGNKAAETSTTPKPATQTQPKKSTAVAPTTKHYNSSNFTLEFDYPASWTVADTTAKLSVLSPSMQLVGSNGQKLEGQVMVTIQNTQTTLPGYPADGAAAALDSQKLTYKKPTPIQRAQSYVSYLSYKQNSLDAIYATGDNGYLAGQQVPMSDVVKGNPLIGVTFINCGTAGCSTGGTSLSLQPSAWVSSQAAKDVNSLLQSLQLD